MDKDYFLILESSGHTCSVCLAEEYKLLAEYTVFKSNQHDRLLAEFVRRILKDHDLIVGDLSAVAVSSGPGSFTGLRIGAAVAKGLCYGNNPKLIAVSSLEAIAYEYTSKQFTSKDDFHVIMSSHKNMVYFQSFNSDAKAITEVKFVSMEELPEEISSQELALSGIKEDISLSLFQTNIELKASTLMNSARNKYLNGEFADSETFEPDYMTEFVVKQKQ